MEYNIYIDRDKKPRNEDTLRAWVHKKIAETYSIPLFKENLVIEKVFWRLSSIKGIHLKIVVIIDDMLMKEEDTFLIIVLALRALWRDDAHRIAIDLERYARYMDISKTNRIFNMKIIDGELNITSDWKIIYRR